MQQVKFLLWAGIVCLAFGAASQAQQNASAPPKTAEAGPSLADTMKLIQDKLNGQGKIEFTSYLAARDPERFASELTKADANPGACHISYHWKAVRHEDAYVDKEFVLNLKDVRNIAVLTVEQYLKQYETVPNPVESYKAEPHVFVIQTALPDDTQDFLFYDKDVANGVAKNMLRAVALCGGRSKLDAKL